MLSILMICTPVYCAPAGTLVLNTASATFTAGGSPQQVQSNTVITSIGRLVNVANTAASAVSGTLDGTTPGYVYSFTVTNTGNANDRFSLDAAFINLNAPVTAIWVDTDGDRHLDPAIDRQLDAADETVVLAAGESVRLLVTAASAGDMQLTATSLNDDPAAVVWHRSAVADVAADNSGTRSSLQLIKSQTVDTRGADAPGVGSIITYTLQAELPAAEQATHVRINDTIPQGTTYVPGSLSLDGAALTDDASDDAGAYDAAAQAISVAVPGTSHPPENANATDVHIVRFQVRIN